MGLGGKDKMEFNDWVHIVEKTPGKGIACYKKMCNYGKKDVEDTRTLWNNNLKHFTPKYSVSNKELVCRTCASENVVRTYHRWRGQSHYQYFDCLEHSGYAGKAIIKKDGKLGGMQ